MIMPTTSPSNTIIRRMRLSVSSDGVTVTLGPGLCGLSSGRRIFSDGSATASLSSPTPSSWYYAYAYESSPGVAGLELSTTAPSAPYPSSSSTARTKSGDQTRRYVGSVYVQSNGLIRPFKHVYCTDLGNKILFSASSSAGSVPLPALLNFVSSSATLIPLNPQIPSTSTHAVLDIKNSSNRTVYLSNPDMGSASPTNFILCAMPNESVIGDIELSSNQSVSAILSTTGLLGGLLGTILAGQVNIYVQGYYFDR